MRKFTLLALALMASTACVVDFVPRAEAREEWKNTYTVEPGGSFEIENTNGTIVVRPGTGDTVEVVATRIAKAGTEEEAKKLLEERPIEESVSASSVRLTSRTRGLNWGHSQYQVNYEVRAPAGLTLRLGATNGTIDVADWDGRVEMSATNGTLDGEGLSGAVKAETTNGRVNIRLDALHDDGVSVETTNGRVSVEMPRDAKARIMARVTNGGIDIDGLDVEPSSSNTRRRYEATVNGGGPTVSLETTNGAISVTGR